MKRLLLSEGAVYDVMDSPVGELSLIATNQGLCALLWSHDQTENLKQDVKNKIIIKTKKQLTEYFNGKRRTFDIPLELNGTDFQIQAWRALQTIPYGQTISYKEQAIKLGDKNKARAVGMANNKNPISIIVPCHRVVGANGRLVGFGGGLDKKAILLTLESSTI